MKTKIVKIIAAVFAAASLGTLAYASGDNTPSSGCSDCESCCASGEGCPDGSCCK